MRQQDKDWERNIEANVRAMLRPYQERQKAEQKKAVKTAIGAGCVGLVMYYLFVVAVLAILNWGIDIAGGPNFAGVYSINLWALALVVIFARSLFSILFSRPSSKT